MLPPMLPRLHGGVRASHATPLPPLQSLHSLHTAAVPPPPAMAVPRHPHAKQLHGAFEQRQRPPLPPPTKPRSLQDEEEDEEDHGTRSRSPDGVDKRARRKEQCRVNQANYRKRKRQHELQLGRAIETLEREIEALTTRRRALAADEALGPEHAIAAFYMAMQTTRDIKDNTPMEMATEPPLMALQSEQFASLDELAAAWRRHQRHFACFRLHVLSTERLEAGEYAIVKTSGELELSLDEKQAPLVCPVQQRFEIDNGTNSVAHVTSEVDLVAGAAAATAKSKNRRTPLAVARVLDDLLRRHALQRASR